MNQSRSVESVGEYIQEAVVRSRPKDLTHAEPGVGEAWKMACPASEAGSWQFFGERLQQEVNDVYSDVIQKARRLRIEEGQQQAAAMACLREFVGYIAWYCVASKDGFALPSILGRGE